MSSIVLYVVVVYDVVVYDELLVCMYCYQSRYVYRVDVIVLVGVLIQSHEIMYDSNMIDCNEMLVVYSICVVFID